MIVGELLSQNEVRIFALSFHLSLYTFFHNLLASLNFDIEPLFAKDPHKPINVRGPFFNIKLDFIR